MYTPVISMVRTLIQIPVTFNFIAKIGLVKFVMFKLIGKKDFLKIFSQLDP